MSTMKALKALDNNTSAKVFIVGGYVRDLLRNKLSDTPDLDIVVCKVSFKRLIKLLEPYGQVKEVPIAKTNDLFNIKVLLFKAKDDILEAQITLPRRGKNNIFNKSNTLKQDARHRDFTINALYLPINYTSKDEIIDFVGGIKDLDNGVLRAVKNAESRLKESPIRIMRAISLAARTEFSLDPDLYKAIKENIQLLNKVPIETFTNEFNDVILSSKPSKYIKLMEKVGILKLFIPELQACVGVTQEIKFHKYDVFNHVIKACDNVKPDLVLRLAALLHDIGKPRVKEVMQNGRITFHKHEHASTELAYKLLKRLKYDNSTIKRVTKLISLHMYHYVRDFTDAAVRRFIIKAGITEKDIANNFKDFELFELRKADRLGNGFKNIAVTPKQLDFQARLKQVFLASNGHDTKDLSIDGSILMEEFELKPGPFIGEILKFLLDNVLEDPNLNNEESLLKLSKKFISEQGDKNFSTK